MGDEQQRTLAAIAGHVKDMDLVVTTAQIPGRPAPRLLTTDMVRSMRPGSVIVDLAAETGGNCELTEAGSVVTRHDVTIDGTLNLPSQMPFHASLLYANNVTSLLMHLAPDGNLNLDWDDEITAGCCVTHAGDVVNERVRESLGLGARQEMPASVGGQAETGGGARGSSGDGEAQ